SLLAGSAASPAGAFILIRSKFLAMNAKLKTALLVVVTLAGVIIVLWYPDQTTGIRKWKLQVVDREGYVAAQAPIRQEWLDPIEDGIVRSDGGDSDANGEVMFPARTLHNRLVLGFAPRHPEHSRFCLLARAIRKPRMGRSTQYSTEDSETEVWQLPV